MRKAIKFTEKNIVAYYCYQLQIIFFHYSPLKISQYIVEIIEIIDVGFNVTDLLIKICCIPQIQNEIVVQLDST
jgi:hypothetical protein